MEEATPSPVSTLRPRPSLPETFVPEVADALARTFMNQNAGGFRNEKSRQLELLSSSNLFRGVLLRACDIHAQMLAPVQTCVSLQDAPVNFREIRATLKDGLALPELEHAHESLKALLAAVELANALETGSLKRTINKTMTDCSWGVAETASGMPRVQRRLCRARTPLRTPATHLRTSILRGSDEADDLPCPNPDRGERGSLVCQRDFIPGPYCTGF